MKLPHILLILGASGLAVSVYALQDHRSVQGSDTQSTYYANGQVQTQAAYVDGRRDGACQRFYADGKKMAEGDYRAGKMEGEWTFWRADGGIDAERTGTYRDGEKCVTTALEKRTDE